MTTLSFHANGKLLLSGEYFVLDGAQAIGLPCSFGQSLKIISHNSSNSLFWKSKTKDGQTWFDGIFNKNDFSILKTSDQKSSETLQSILLQAQLLNPNFLKTKASLSIETQLEFPRLWGLGSSSTLIYTIAKWAKVDPFKLSSKTLGGSGYDIACAGVDHPILYQIKNGESIFKKVNFNPSFKQNIFFVYLAKKQNSREGIKHYRNKAKKINKNTKEITSLSQELLSTKSLKDFQKIIIEHERIVSDTIKMKRAQDLYFSNFDGVIKSLGAWGGDFVLAATELDEKKAKEYFNKKGFKVFLSYEKMIKQ